MVGAIVGGLTLFWNLMRSFVGRVTVLARPSSTCDISFYEFNHSWGRIWRVSIRTRPPNDVIIRNAEGRKYRFEARLSRLNYGGLVNSIAWAEGWNIGEKDKRHESPIDLSHEGDFQTGWMSSNTSDWLVEVWITVGSKRMKTLYKGHPTGSIAIGRDN